MQALADLVLQLAASPWIYAVVVGLVVVDSVFPLFPSEVAVVGLSALVASSGSPDLFLLLLAAAGGALLGDNTTFLAGRLFHRVGVDGWSFRPLAWMLAWARRGLEHRAGVLILTARFIPGARLAVNLAAGMTGFPYGRFVPSSAVASSLWALYNVAIGYTAGHWFGDNPLLGMAVAIVLAAITGWLLDLAIGRLRSRMRQPG